MTSICIFISGATLLVYRAERMIGSLGDRRLRAFAADHARVRHPQGGHDRRRDCPPRRSGRLNLGLALVAICGIIIGTTFCRWRLIVVR